MSRTVYLNPNSAPRTFFFEQKFSDQEAYARVADVKIEVYEALIRLMDSGASLAVIKTAMRDRLSNIYAGEVDHAVAAHANG